MKITCTGWDEKTATNFRLLSFLKRLSDSWQIYSRLSGRSHAYTVATMSHRTTHYKENSSSSVLHDCETTYPQISFQLASIFRCLNQGKINTFYYPLLLSDLYIYPPTLSFIFQANAVQCICIKNKKNRMVECCRWVIEFDEI